MKLKAMIAGALLSLGSLASAQAQSDGSITLYAHPGFAGESTSITGAQPTLGSRNFNDRASSARVSGRWQVCTDPNYRGRCEIVSGDAFQLAGIGFNDNISSVRPAPETASPGNTASAAVTLYSQENFGGTSSGVNMSSPRLATLGFNDRAKSLRIRSGVWRVCDDANFQGRCVYLTGDVPSLRDYGLSGSVTSIQSTNYTKPPQDYRIALFKGTNQGGDFAGFDSDVSNLGARGFNDAASSVYLARGETWVACSDADYRGDCHVLRESADNLYALNLSNRISSIRRYDRRRDSHLERPANSGDGDGYGRGDGDGNNRPGRSAYMLEGETTVFFPRPLENGRSLNSFIGTADRFCRDNGFRRAVHESSRNGLLTDVLCER